MNLGMSLRIALNALRVNKLRSALTMLGIIIGTAAVIAMVSIGSGAQSRVADQIKSLGSNIMIIVPGSTTQGGVRLGAGANQVLTEDDALAIARDISGVIVAAPTSRNNGQVVAGNQNWGTSIYGATNDWLEAREWPIADGRLFEPDELRSGAKVVIIGETVARELFGGQDPLEQQIRIRKVPFTVIGVLSRKGQSLLGQDQDDLVLVPLAAHRSRLFGTGQGRLRRVGTITVKVQEGVDMKQVESRVLELMRQRHRVQDGQPDSVSIRNLTEMLETQEAASRVMTVLLASVAGVSLLVGGIGIMNIMLVSVTERTREIGLRMAVGAKGRHILTQFLVEAVVLALLGGAMGIGLGLLVSYGVEQLSGWRIELSLWSIALAAGFSAAVGIFFGWYPARKASRLLPIQALRYE
ncbi:MAG: ABC transporter permease [Burkholderiales bacterium]|jgi:putative ABC transport system permease protein|nr:ABC transporter permease [Burkholderiales bacterium]MCA3162004.1 ABC transporter permease [Burkholderiales bacterium]MCA3164563.1 ABC transporter permease [Burkholderiales bacterium]MCA3164926.1 ABC transporter permease [Burkholderiales bacterium]MCA3169435.1 ABC transporter permease [Burkholderiales bacterium]